MRSSRRPPAEAGFGELTVASRELEHGHLSYEWCFFILLSLSLGVEGWFGLVWFRGFRELQVPRRSASWGERLKGV